MRIHNKCRFISKCGNFNLIEYYLLKHSIRSCYNKMKANKRLASRGSALDSSMLQRVMNLKIECENDLVNKSTVQSYIDSSFNSSTVYLQMKVRQLREKQKDLDFEIDNRLRSGEKNWTRFQRELIDQRQRNLEMIDEITQAIEDVKKNNQFKERRFNKVLKKVYYEDYFRTDFKLGKLGEDFCVLDGKEKIKLIDSIVDKAFKSKEMKGREVRAKFWSSNLKRCGCYKSRKNESEDDNNYGGSVMLSCPNSLILQPSNQTNKAEERKVQDGKGIINIRTSRNMKKIRKSYIFNDNSKLNKGLDTSDKFIQKMLKEQNISQSRSLKCTRHYTGALFRKEKLREIDQNMILAKIKQFRDSRKN